MNITCRDSVGLTNGLSNATAVLVSVGLVTGFTLALGMSRYMLLQLSLAYATKHGFSQHFMPSASDCTQDPDCTLLFGSWGCIHLPAMGKDRHMHNMHIHRCLVASVLDKQRDMQRGAIMHSQFLKQACTSPGVV